MLLEILPDIVWCLSSCHSSSQYSQLERKSTSPDLTLLIPPSCLLSSDPTNHQSQSQSPGKIVISRVFFQNPVQPFLITGSGVLRAHIIGNCLFISRWSIFDHSYRVSEVAQKKQNVPLSCWYMDQVEKKSKRLHSFHRYLAHSLPFKITDPPL